MLTRPDVRLVAPFRPFAPENDLHRELADFDWVAALRMLSRSCEVSCGASVEVLTDVDTALPLPLLRYVTHERRLMLWNLEVCLAYLQSDDFDRDTVMLDADQLVYQDLRPLFVYNADLGVAVRGSLKHADGWQKLLNGVQFWSVRGKARLVAFYRQALDVARALSEELVVWGADTAALCRLIEPCEIGSLSQRAGAVVHAMDYRRVVQAFSATDLRHLDAGRVVRPVRPVLDFRWTRKRHMARVFAQTFGTLEAVAS